MYIHIYLFIYIYIVCVYVCIYIHSCKTIILSLKQLFFSMHTDNQWGSLLIYALWCHQTWLAGKSLGQMAVYGCHA